jgi:23S rRNA pseudouridine2605 synthase
VEERLHKLLARHGIGSRRQVEDWIAEGRVTVNGQPASVGQRVGEGDRISVDGRDVTRRLEFETRLRVIVYHKPAGEMLRSREGDERAGIEANLPALRGGRWLPINALGYNEDGLLLLASDGEFVSALTRLGATTAVEYRVRALRPRQAEDWPEMPVEVDTDAGAIVFSAVERLDGGATNAWFRVAAARTVPRGAVRALFDAAGLKVSRVMLVAWGPVGLPRDLPRGRARDLAGAELEALLALAGRPVVDEPPPRRSPRGRPGARGRGSVRKKAARRSGGR